MQASAQSASGTRYRFGLFEFDADTGELRKNGQIVKLAPQPARVLALLLAHAGDVVLRDDLRAHLWGSDTFVDFERGLNFCILQVRQALGDSADNARFVQTVPRRGYRFTAPVALLVPAAHEPTSVPRAPTSVPSPPTTVPRPPTSVPGASTSVPARDAGARGGGWRGVALACAGAIAILAPLAWLALAGAAAPADRDRLRIAVLPFSNLTGDAADDDLVDGLTSELITELGRVSANRLAIIARTSVMRYRDTEKSAREIGRDLSAAYLVEGTVRRDGSRVRITVDLVETADETQLWAETFERVTAESMDVQAAIAARVARALTIELTPATAAAPPPPTRNTDAWDAYLRGRALMARGTAADVTRALDQFETAVKIDPAFAAAWAQLADARHVLVMIGARAPAESYLRAADAAAHAVRLDPSLAEAHVAAGLVALWWQWRPLDAARSFERALELNPSHAVAHHDYAWTLVAQQRFDEAVAHMTAARDLDPLSIRANADIGWLYLHIRRPAEATRACQQTLALEPQSLEAQACLERAYLSRGLADEALRAARATLGNHRDAVLASAPGAPAGLEAIWRWRLERLQAASRTRWISPYSLATLLLQLGDRAAAVEQIEAAYEQRVAMMPFLHTDPAVDGLRGDPRFEKILRLTRVAN